MSSPKRYDVTVTDGRVSQRHARVGWIARNRLVDFAFRHDLQWCVREADPEPERRSYR